VFEVKSQHLPRSAMEVDPTGACPVVPGKNIISYHIQILLQFKQLKCSLRHDNTIFQTCHPYFY